MTAARAAYLAVAVALALGPPARADEARQSLPTESAGAAWLRSGFRLQLGAVSGRFAGLEGAPSGWLAGPLVRIGMRLDRDWSLLASFEYAATPGNGALSGLRYAATLDPTWHFSPQWSVALGFGVGGIVEGHTGREDPDPLPSTIDTSYTFPDASPPIASCKGTGVAGLARVEWMHVLARRTSMGLSLELAGQWTQCVDDTGRVEPDTARPIVRRQLWPHAGVTLAWVVAWR